MPTKLRRRLAQRLTPQRLSHVLGVEGIAVILAKKWGLDPERAMLAALLHDVAKPEPRAIQQALMEAGADFRPTDEDLCHPKIWHGLAGAHVARTELGVTDIDILEAVAWHPTGKARIRPLGLLLYVSDYVEPSRNFPGVSEQRRHFMSLDLHGAALEVARAKLHRLEQQGQKAHSRTVEMRNWLEGQPPES